MSKKGTTTFIIQRASAVLLMPLAAWLMFSLIVYVGAGYEAARGWIANWVNGLLFGAFIIIGAWHARIGMAEIITDYIHSWLKDILLFVNWLVALCAIVAVAWSVYNISFAG